MTSQPSLRCAVVGPHDWLDLDEVLAESGSTVVEVAFGSDPIATIRRANFLLAFLDGRTPGTLVDVGIALALRKPLLLIAESPTEIPDRLLGHPWLLTKGLAPEDLALQITTFASAFLPKTSPARDTAFTHVLKSFDDAVLKKPTRAAGAMPKASSREPSREQFHSDTEFRVAEDLFRAGATVIAQLREPAATSVPDMAASFPELGPSFSTVLVEIAGRKARLASKKSALRAAMEERGLQLGMLVTLEEPQDTEPEPGVLVIPLRRLEELVETGELLPTLKMMRNRVVHRVN